MKVPVCECCGFPLVADEIGVVLTPLQRRIFNIVKRAGAAGISSPEVMEMVYQNAPDGGPDSTNIVAVVCNQMNKRLKQFNLKVQGRRGPNGFITLQRLPGARFSKQQGALA